MKSLVEAAASIFKAIEKGWHRAGCPQEFTVKVLEEAETNFLGITGKPAKVALFFMDDQSNKSNTAQPVLKEPTHTPHDKKPYNQDNRHKRRRPPHNEKRNHKDTRDRRFDKRHERPLRDEKTREYASQQDNRRDIPSREAKHTASTLFRSTHRKTTASHPAQHTSETSSSSNERNHSSDDNKQ